MKLTSSSATGGVRCGTRAPDEDDRPHRWAIPATAAGKRPATPVMGFFFFQKTTQRTKTDQEGNKNKTKNGKTRIFNVKNELR